MGLSMTAPADTEACHGEDDDVRLLISNALAAAVAVLASLLNPNASHLRNLPRRRDITAARSPERSSRSGAAGAESAKIAAKISSFFISCALVGMFVECRGIFGRLEGVDRGLGFVRGV